MTAIDGLVLAIDVDRGGSVAIGDEEGALEAVHLDPGGAMAAI